jgi:dTMP kinase
VRESEPKLNVVTSRSAISLESLLSGPLPDPSLARRFFAIEGLDGSGTSTQTNLIAARLREGGIEVHETQEPTRGLLGSVATQHVLGRTFLNEYTMALTFSADRLDHLLTEVAPKLEGGFWVISDRYYLSTLAYQGMKIALDSDVRDPAEADRARLDEAFDWIWEMNRFAYRPQATVFLDVPPEVCLARTNRSRYTRETYDAWPTPLLVGTVYNYAIEYAKRRGDRIFRMNGYDRKPEVIADDIADVLLAFAPKGGGKTDSWINQDGVLPLEE